jgi:hypothetical protein
LGTVAVHRGELDVAAEHVRRYPGDLAGGEAVLHSGQYDWVELLLAHAQGGPARAVELARIRVGESLRRMLIEEPGAAPWLVRLALTVGDSRLATAVLTGADDLAANNPGYGSISVSAAHAHGLVDRDADALLAAASRHRHPWAKACANSDLATLFTARGEAAEAALRLDVACLIFERMGAIGEVARLRSRPSDVTEAGGDAGVAPPVGAGTRHRPPGRRRPDQPPGGKTTLPVPAHGRLPPAGHLPKARHQLRVELARLAHEQAPTKA